jgi:hypothetical protein
MNNYNVICVGDKRISGYECRKNGLLLTLEQNDNPTTVMNELFDINNRVQGGGIERGGAIAIDILVLLKTAPIIELDPISPEIQKTPTHSTPDLPRGIPVPAELQSKTSIGKNTTKNQRI